MIHRARCQVFLSAPYPLPETMIASNPEYYYNYTMEGWIGTTMRRPGLDWVQDAVAPYLDPEKGKARIAAACEDVRTPHPPFLISHLTPPSSN